VLGLRAQSLLGDEILRSEERAIAIPLPRNVGMVRGARTDHLVAARFGLLDRRARAVHLAVRIEVFGQTLDDVLDRRLLRIEGVSALRNVGLYEFTDLRDGLRVGHHKKLAPMNLKIAKAQKTGRRVRLRVLRASRMSRGAC
jgi:hypothetical protein